MRHPKAAMDLTAILPPEILTEIFKQLHLLSLYPRDTLSPSSSSRRIRGQNWSVSQVCKYWRDVALSVPFLWTHLPLVNLEDGQPTPPSEKLECIQTLLDRCQDAPLHVSLALSPQGSFVDTRAVHQQLVDHAEHWKSLTVCASIPDTEAILQGLTARFPLLEELSLSIMQSGLDTVGILHMFETAPRLRSITLAGDAAHWVLFVDTKSLVHLNDKVGAFLHVVETLDDYPSLTTLKLHDTGIFDYDELLEDIEENTVELPALKTLKYVCDDYVLADDAFLQFPITPVLEELFVEARCGEVLPLLMDLFERSGPMPLKTLCLKIDTDSCEVGEFTRLLGELPQLEILEADLPCMEELGQLSIVTGPEALVPNLKKCTFRFHGDNFDGTHLALTRFASDRCGTPAPMDLSFTIDLLSSIRRNVPGFGHARYQYLGLQPTRLEPWYGQPYPHIRWESSNLPRTAYSVAEATIPAMLLTGYGSVNMTSFEYKHMLELLTAVQERYNKPSELIKFLETNMNICLIALAYVLKTHLPEQQKTRKSPYNRIIRLLKKVRADLMERLDDFHWIWETSLTDISIRYIPDGHEMRKDREAFANAVLGITDDPWVLDEF